MVGCLVDVCFVGVPENEEMRGGEVFLVFDEFGRLDEVRGLELEGEVADTFGVDHGSFVGYACFGSVEVVSFDEDDEVVAIVGDAIIAILHVNEIEMFAALQVIVWYLFNEFSSMVEYKEVVLSEYEVELQKGMLRSMYDFLVVDIGVDESLEDGIQSDGLSFGEQKELCVGVVQKFAVGYGFDSTSYKTFGVFLLHIIITLQLIQKMFEDSARFNIRSYLYV